MYLRTPKRYTAKGSRRPLLNLKWLWLYLLVPVCLLPLVLAWDYRDSIQAPINQFFVDHPLNFFQMPTPTPTELPKDIGPSLKDAFSAGHIGKAISLLSSISDATPNDIVFHGLLTQLLVLRSYGSNKPMLSEAIKAGQNTINADPEVADGWIAEAMALDFAGSPQQALSYILRASEIAERNPLVMAVMAEIYSDLGKYDQASKLIDEAITAAKAKNPLDRLALSHAYYVKAQILISTAADGKEVIQQLEAAWRAATTDTDQTIPSGYIAQQLGQYYANADQTDRAINLVADAIKRDQDDPILQLQMSKFYVKLGQPSKARLYVEKCHDLDPNQVKCLRVLAQLYFNEQNYAQTQQTLAQVIAQSSDQPYDYYLEGLSYSYLNQCSAAVEVLQSGLVYIKADDAKTRVDFETVLRQCGATSGLPIDNTPTPAPTAAATPAVTPSKKK
jgi:tetratricopeptide (TPR) repeat protein